MSFNNYSVGVLMTVFRGHCSSETLSASVCEEKQYRVL